MSDDGSTIERWLRRNARHDVPEAGIVLGILALAEHDGLRLDQWLAEVARQNTGDGHHDRAERHVRTAPGRRG